MAEQHTHTPIHNPQLAETLYSESLIQVNWECLAADDNWFLTATTFGGAANESDTITSFTKDYCPLWPVCPVVVVTDNAADDWTAVAVTFVGYDQFGDWISHAVAATNSSGTWTATSLKAFEKLESVTIAVTGTTTTSDSYIIGFAKTYGLGRRITAAAELINSLFDGAADSGTLSTVHQTYVIAGTPDGAKAMTFLIRPKAAYGR
jgi:hypothetical protein